MNKADHNRHEFAFFVDQLSSLVGSSRTGVTISVADPDLVHRIGNVLRLQPGDGCVIFDAKLSADAVVESYVGKKAIKFMLSHIQPIVPLTPAITFLLPLLKRENFETAIYGLVELGVTVIQPVITQKAQRSWAGAKEVERIKKIMIAAAEQSKHYAMPELREPLTFEAVCALPEGTKIYFDPAGEPLWDVVTTVRASKPSAFCIMVGPEGDLTPEEKSRLSRSGYTLCALTPTVLRSFQAALLGLGAFRALIKS